MSRTRDNDMARYLAGEMKMNEEIAFLEKKGSNPKQQIELENMEKSWKYFDENPSGKKWNSDKAWDQLCRRLESDGLLEDVKPGAENRNLLPLLRIAATILLLLAIGIPALYFGVFRNSSGEPLKIQYCEKGVTTVDLPDGSRVYLNERAEITYPALFKQERVIKLKGEAFFEVMSDPVNPFTVHSDKVIISVLGTSFNVKQSTQTPDIEVYVKTGKVRMAMEGTNQFITLQPEEVGLTENLELARMAQEDPNYISWMTKDFKFVDARLMDVLLELEESYHVEIHSNGVDISDMKITASYREQSIEAILETIGAAFGMNINKLEDGYYLTK